MYEHENLYYIFYNLIILQNNEENVELADSDHVPES